MKNLIFKSSTFFLTFITFILFSCKPDMIALIDPEPNYEFWSPPSEEAFALFFILSDEMKIDSVFAGKIQFRLNLARTVDEELDSIFAKKHFEFGALLLGVSDDLYNNFNTVTYRFNYQPLDSLLDVYKLISGTKLSGFPGNYAVKLIFSIIYNMPILAKVFNDIPGIKYSCANSYGIIPDESFNDIYLEIENNIYKFIFYKKVIINNYEHHWEVHVVDDHAELIAEW